MWMLGQAPSRTPMISTAGPTARGSSVGTRRTLALAHDGHDHLVSQGIAMRVPVYSQDGLRSNNTYLSGGITLLS